MVKKPFSKKLLDGWRTVYLSNEIFFPVASLAAGGFAVLTDHFDLAKVILHFFLGQAVWIEAVPSWLYGTVGFLAVFSVALSFRTVSLRADLDPKMRALYDPSDAGCHVKRTAMIDLRKSPSQIVADYHRIKVTSNALIEGISGTLVRITSQKNGVIFEGENLKLTHAHGGGADKVDLRDKIPAYIDVLRIDQNNLVLVATPEFRYPTYVANKLVTLSDTHDRYDFEILISADNSPTMKMALRLVWKGDWETAKMSDITGGS